MTIGYLLYMEGMEGFFDSIAIKNSKSRNLSFFTKRIEISSSVCILLCDPTVWSIEIILHSNLLHFSSRKMAITKRQRLPKKRERLDFLYREKRSLGLSFSSCFRTKKLSDQKHVALFVLCHLTPFSSYCHYERYTSHNTYLLAIAFAHNTNLLFTTPLLCKFSFQFHENTCFKVSNFYEFETEWSLTFRLIEVHIL